MKQLADNSEVTARSYYFLLDFNDRDDWKTIVEMFGVNKISDLTKEQYAKLFEEAAKRELENLKS